MNPPQGFLEPSLPINQIEIRWRKYSRRIGNTAAKEAGLRFEEKVQTALLDLFPLYEAEPQIIYWTPKGPRNAFPDGLLLLPERTIIIEIKRQHMPEAWWQLRRHYSLVMERYRVQPIQCIEIVKDFDCAMPFPEPYVLHSSIHEALAYGVNDFGVVKWSM